jgi:hypothetical protein
LGKRTDFILIRLVSHYVFSEISSALPAATQFTGTFAALSAYLLVPTGMRRPPGGVQPSCSDYSPKMFEKIWLKLTKLDLEVRNCTADS